MPDHYTTLEVAKMLGMAVRSVQLMVDRNELEAWKTPGGPRRISRASVERWMTAHGAGGAAPAPAASTPVASRPPSGTACGPRQRARAADPAD